MLQVCRPTSPTLQRFAVFLQEGGLSGMVLRWQRGNYRPHSTIRLNPSSPRLFAVDSGRARSAEAAPPALSTRSPTWWWTIRPPRHASPLPQAAARPAEAAFSSGGFPAAVSPAQAPLELLIRVLAQEPAPWAGSCASRAQRLCSPKSRAGNEGVETFASQPGRPRGGAWQTAWPECWAASSTIETSRAASVTGGPRNRR